MWLLYLTEPLKIYPENTDRVGGKVYFIVESYLHILVIATDGGGCSVVQAKTAESKVVVFRVGREEYAVSIEMVKEVITWIEPTPVPDAPSGVEGVISLRGDVIPVVDLGRLFRAPRQSRQADGRIIVMEVNEERAGFVVDAVSEVQHISAAMVAQPSPMLRQGSGQPNTGAMIAGIIKFAQGRLVALIDPVRIITSLHLEGQLETAQRG
jgi:purine-binding chemotaxis protein CheW